VSKKIIFLAPFFTLLFLHSLLNAQCSVLSWSDEFEKSNEINTRYWVYDLGNGCPDLCGWGNNELQCYTSENKNVRIENGTLVLEVHKDETTECAYSSTKLVSRGLKSMQYGTIEVRAKLPGGKGVWPAIWMMPENKAGEPWPRCGEIDIMEHVGFEPNRVYGTVHTEAYNHMDGTEKGGYLERDDYESEFHTYKIKWSPERIEWYIDKVRYYTFARKSDDMEEWPFDQPFYLILNVAVGGNWGGSQGIDDDIWPQRMEVDYVRCYRD